MKKYTKKEKGFTLIELLVTTFLFSIIITIVGSLFVQIMGMQRRAFLLQQAHENINFIVETIAREVRVGNMCTLTFPCGSLPDRLNITHPVNGRIEYYLDSGNIHRVLSDSGVTCSSPPCDSILNSSAVIFTRFQFLVDGEVRDDLKQPRVTVVIGVESNDPSRSISINTQTTMSQRLLID